MPDGRVGKMTEGTPIEDALFPSARGQVSENRRMNMPNFQHIPSSQSGTVCRRSSRHAVREGQGPGRFRARPRRVCSSEGNGNTPSPPRSRAWTTRGSRNIYTMPNSVTSRMTSSDLPHAKGCKTSSLAATARQAEIRSVTIRSLTSRSPSYSPRLRISWHFASTRQTSGPSSSVCGRTWNTT